MKNSMHTRGRLTTILRSAGGFFLALALVVSLSACGDNGSGLEAPTLTQSFSSETLTADQDPITKDLSSSFSGENLTYQAISSASDVASTSIDGTTLTVDPQSGGTATVTVSAENDAGSAEGSFDVTVQLPGAPGPPS